LTHLFLPSFLLRVRRKAQSPQLIRATGFR